MSAEARWLCGAWLMIGLAMAWKSDVIALMFAVGAFACWLMSWQKELPK